MELHSDLLAVYLFLYAVLHSAKYTLGLVHVQYKNQALFTYTQSCELAGRQSDVPVSPIIPPLDQQFNHSFNCITWGQNLHRAPYKYQELSRWYRSRRSKNKAEHPRPACYIAPGNYNVHASYNPFCTGTTLRDYYSYESKFSV